MSVQLTCPNLRCRKIFAFEEDLRGKMVACRNCKTTFRVPEKLGGRKENVPPSSIAFTSNPIIPTTCLLDLYVKEKAGDISTVVGCKGERLPEALRSALDALRKLARDRGVDDSAWLGAVARAA